ncbi:hypothetical protein, partial [Nonomuraea sp. B19D2]|uniref:hypothetical protein n=1 Tax=Nonomuraea sp. B19D2 TaxID=3159561 RepID=UPI0032DAC925
MNSMYSEIGKRVTIADAFHSHVQTRAYKDQLIGREGVIVAVLRNGKVALVELDDDGSHFPAGVRRWSFCWDDLHIETKTNAHQRRAVEYRAGFTWKGRQAVQHAVPPEKTIALCGQTTRPFEVPRTFRTRTQVGSEAVREGSTWRRSREYIHQSCGPKSCGPS